MTDNPTTTTAPASECFECGATDGLEAHHVLPREVGGTRTVLLCGHCHGDTHRVYRPDNLSALVKAGQARARLQGRHPGRPRKAFPADRQHAVLVTMLRKGIRKSELHALGISRAAVRDAALNYN